ncbi:hypothetical protein [Streptomyces sp. NPDC046759]|uniref:hypothetical protein n=1 Tax=Streptomyces sp. NPDC046759 TaxID=3155019 RepID=UPI0033D7D17F
MITPATTRSSQRSEARRGERLALLERFIDVSTEAERCACARPSERDDTHTWYLTTREIMARFWVADRLIRIQFPLPVHDAAHAHFLDLDRTVGEGLPDGESVRDYLEDNRPASLDAARASWGSAPGDLLRDSPCEVVRD